MQPDSGVLTVTSLAEFFRDALHGVLEDQGTAVDEQTERYVVDMLTLFARAEHLQESASDDGGLKTLAQMLGEALEAASAAERERALQRLGDVSLFTAGFFARGMARRLVDVDYHIAMGGGAYDTLARSLERRHRRGPAEVFAELAAKFRQLTDALGEIADAAYVYSQRDVLRLYEIWLKTGSERTRRLLRRMGIEPSPVALRTH
ncbi:MAG TPA: hypothetical protein VJO54_15985 [Burkholderiales bacterium]|nr:hypothetical protein [Burkholderiales bacterium]